MVRITRLILPMLALILAGCTPSHTVDKTSRYARELGLTNQYDVQRWHGRQIPASSRLLIVLSAESALPPKEVTDAVRAGFSVAFASVQSVPGILPRNKALSRALELDYDFLLDIREMQVRAPYRNDSGKEEPAPEAGEDTQSEEPPTQRAARVRLEIAMIDVVSGRTVEKFLVTAGSAHYNLAGSELQTLLYQPLSKLADDLAAP